MNNEEKAKLEQLMSQNNVQDNTETIKNNKISAKIRRDIQYILQVKREHPDIDHKELDEKCNGPCIFLFTNYTMVYNLFIKNNLDMKIMDELLTQLEKIENGQLNQQEASYEVGKILKNIYVDTVMTQQKQNEILEKEEAEKKLEEQKGRTKNISWTDFKNMHRKS